MNHPGALFLRLAVLVSCAAALALPSGGATAQGTAADYERAASLQQRSRDGVRNADPRVQWIGDERLWYVRDRGDGANEVIVVDLATGDRSPAFDHDALAGAVRDARPAGRDRDAPVLFERVVADGDDWTLLVRGETRAWRCSATGSIEPRDLSGAPELRLRRARADARSGARSAVNSGVIVVNRRADAVRLVWISSDGTARPYGTVEPGATRRQHTFAGHVWSVRGADEEELGRWRATEGPGVILLDDEPDADADARRDGIEVPPEGEFRRVSVRRRELPNARANARPNASPDGAFEARFEDHQLVVVRSDDGTEVVRTTDGRPGNAWEGRLLWSPDSSSLLAWRVERPETRRVHIVEASPDGSTDPRLITFDYAKPGDDLPVHRPAVVDLANGELHRVPDTLLLPQWNVTRVRAEPDGSRFTMLLNERGHQRLRYLEIDRAGRASTVFEETSETFIDYAGKLFLRVLPETNEIIWMSERDGWNHLYLLDAQTGETRNAITSGEWVVRGVDRVDPDSRRIWFRAGGIVPGEDPYHVHHCRVDFDGSDLIVLTEGDGTHEITWSPSRRFFVDRWSRVDLPPVTVVRDGETGRLVSELERADWSGLLERGWRPPERFVAPGRDGTTPIHGIIHRPSNHDPSKRYPVVEQIYAGPHSAHVPKSFRSFHGAQRMAELGFVVVQIDGMGTSHRSKAFHDVAWKNLADSGFPDRIAWIRAAAERDPSLDLSRVGIYGGSAGGQSAMRALIDHHEFYDVAVADCGCHDNRVDKVWWNELWMGWPIDESYARSSNVDHANRMRGDLLLIVGEIDRNVDPASTMQVVKALVAADLDFDLLVLPSTGHGAAESPYGSRRRADFLVRHLHGVEPRAN